MTALHIAGQVLNVHRVLSQLHWQWHEGILLAHRPCASLLILNLASWRCKLRLRAWLSVRQHLRKVIVTVLECL
jgi:hypothetical protein